MITPSRNLGQPNMIQYQQPINPSQFSTPGSGYYNNSTLRNSYPMTPPHSSYPNQQNFSNHTQYPQNNTHIPAQKPYLAPYQYDSKIKFDYIGTVTYRQMIITITRQLEDQIKKQRNLMKELKDNKSEQTLIIQLQKHTIKIADLCRCNQQIITRLNALDRNLLDDIVYLFAGNLSPQDIQWQIWKHSIELTRYIKQIQPEMDAMVMYQKRKADTGARILQLYDSLTRIKRWGPNDMPLVVQFINLTGNHPFLKKSVVFLTFIQHCMPLYLWKIKVYQQVPIYYNPNLLTKIVNKAKQHQIQNYLTVTGDGLIISTKNPLDTKIDQMVPFTNQFLFSSQIQDDDQLYYTVSSCTHQNVKVSFKKDYVGGVNFHLGMLRAFIDSGNNNINRFSSFSRPRQNCWTRLYNDGIGYFEDLCEEMMKARKQICITDWWMTPYFLLKRDTTQKIDIHRTTYRLDGILRKLANRGIKIFIILFRQPLDLVCNDSYQVSNYLQSFSLNIRVRRHPIMPQKWSHHQKCVIIDQRVGFMGGLDICYGRWDTPQHFLTNKNNYWDGADYTNQRLRGFAPGSTDKFTESPVDRTKEARMPWHDIGIQLKGDAVIDLAKHFIQYWYFVNAERVKDPYNHFRNVKRRFDKATQYKIPDWDQLDIDRTQDKRKEPSCGEAISLCGIKTKLFVTGTQKRVPQLLVQAKQGKIKGTQQLQMCRSASNWSIGARDFEQSIHYAYQTLIKESQHFIYIENQFFMGQNNKIVQCLAQRIRKAHLNKENFKIVVVMPLLPGFQGDIANVNNKPLRVQVHNQFQNINRGENSIHQKLKDLKNFLIDDYIFFFGLRNHGTLDNKAITQIIYVHSKLMIVDDKRAIIGSANINDRSLCGDRDSELAIVIEEDNGKIQDKQLRRKQIFDLRARLFNEHFGLTPDQTANINSFQVWAKVINNAKRNTLIYRQLFGCYPDDTITVGDQAQQRVNQSQPHLYSQLAPNIFGHAVQFPLHFMEDEDLQLQTFDKQNALGVQMFL